MITFIIPSAPSANNLFANIPGRGRVRSERYRTWAHAAGWSMKECYPEGWEVMTGPVSVAILDGNARRDLDNGIKPVLDLLTDMRVIEDDKQVVGLHITRGGKPKEAIVTVRAI